ncbi:ras-GEF domain-containing family member 1B isoform 2-T8 [Glossina fuscipes fuscipes]
MSNNGLNNATNGRNSANNNSSNNSQKPQNSKSASATTVQHHPHHHLGSINANVNAHNTKSINLKGVDGKTKPIITTLPDKTKQHTTATAITQNHSPAVTSTTTTTTATTTTTTQYRTNSNINQILKNVNTTAIAPTFSSGSGNVARGNTINKIAVHRRDTSSVNGQAGQQNLQQSLRDPNRYRYVKPQTFLTSVQALESSINDVVDKVGETGRLNNDSHTLVYYEDNLISGSLEALIEHMVPTHDYYPDKIYIFSFLLSARLFIRPHELLAKISQTWERQQQQQQQQQSNAVTCALISSDQVDDAGHFNYMSLSNNSASPLSQHKSDRNEKQLLSPSPPPPLPQQHQQQQQQHQKQQQQQRTHTQKSAQNCIRLLAEWIETFPYDFRDERLMQQVRILTRKCVYIDNSLGKQVSRILQLLVQRLTALEKYEEFLQTLLQSDFNNATSSQQSSHYSTSASASYNSSSGINAHNSLSKAAVHVLNSHHHQQMPHHQHYYDGHQKAVYLAHSHLANLSSSTNPASYANSSFTSSASSAGVSSTDSTNSHDVFGIMDLCSSCAQLAHQLTAIELERLSHIGPEEFVQAFAKEYHNAMATTNTATISNKQQSATDSTQLMSCSSLNDMKKTRNLESYVEWFNRLSYLTASEIVKYPKKKQRVRIIEYWIETARECFNIGNFNSLMAIIAGLNLSPISRLKKTWSKVQSAKFSVLEHQMDPTSNFNSYRSTLKAAMWRSEGATEERERIIIPFFSLFVKDLYFLNEGCSNRLPNNHINFEKCSQLAKQVMEFNEWKKVKCPFEKLPHVIAYLQNSLVLNENTLSMSSFECEPPENTEEKDRYKTVKAETKQQLLQQLQEQQLQQQQQQQQ